MRTASLEVVRTLGQLSAPVASVCNAGRRPDRLVEPGIELVTAEDFRELADGLGVCTGVAEKYIRTVDRISHC